MFAFFRLSSLVFVLGLCVGTASAIGLGELKVRSHLGESFSGEVTLIERSDQRRAEATCFRAGGVPEANSSIPSLPRSRVRIERANGQSRLFIRSDQLISEPVLQVNVWVGCGSEILRSYTVLIDPAPLVERLPLQAIKPFSSGEPVQRIAPMVTPAVPQVGHYPTQWTTAEGESALGIARALFPRQPSAQRRFLAALRSGNPAIDMGADGNFPLAAGMTLAVPDTRRHTQVSAAENAEPPPFVPSPPVKQKKAVRRDAGRMADRLVISLDAVEGGGGIGQALQMSTELSTRFSMHVTENSRSVLRLEYQLLDSLYSQAEQQLAIAERVRKLEAALEEMRVATEQLSAQGVPAKPVETVTSEPKSVATKPAPPVTRSSSGGWLEAGVLVLLTGLLVGYFIRRTRQRRTEVTTAFVGEVERLEIARSTGPSGDQPSPEVQDKAAYTALDLDLNALSPATVQDSHDTIDFSNVNPLDETDVGEANDHHTVMELADIMICYGRIHGATEALEDFLAHEPGKALQPWLKLLDIYRENGLREKFEACANRFRLHFNVELAAWDEIGDSLKEPATPIDAHKLSKNELIARLPSISAYPHVREDILRLWGTPEALQYVVHLLRDTRNGQRGGLPLALVHELLFVADLLDNSVSA